jgi:hypothetical protein
MLMATIFMASPTIDDRDIWDAYQSSFNTISTTVPGRTSSNSYRSQSMYAWRKNITPRSDIYIKYALDTLSSFYVTARNSTTELARIEFDSIGNLLLRRGTTTLQTIIDLGWPPWSVIEIYTLINATTGKIHVKINGVLVAELNNANTGASDIDNVIFQPSAHVIIHIDDIVFDDANWPGLGGIEVLRPDANGHYTAWDAGGFADVNADNDGTYIATDAEVAAKHSFTLPAPAATPSRVGLWTKSQLSGAGAGTLRPFFRTSGSDTPGDSLALSTSLAWQAQYGSTMPDEVGLEVVV